MGSLRRLPLLAIAGTFAACATHPEHHRYVEGRCLEPGARALVTTFAEAARVETAVLGATVRPGFRFYEAVRVPRGTVLVRRGPGEYCADKVEFFPPAGDGLPNGEIRNPAILGRAYVCFHDDDGDGRFEAATAHDDSDRRGENAEPATRKLAARPTYALAACSA